MNRMILILVHYHVDDEFELSFFPLGKLVSIYCSIWNSCVLEHGDNGLSGEL